MKNPLFIAKFLQDKRKYPKRRAKISSNISVLLSGSRVTKSQYTNTQKLNFRCLTCLHLAYAPGAFYSNPKNVRNMITIANTNIL